MKKLLFVMVLALLVSLPLHAVDVDWGGLFYHYTFWWQNADFDSDLPVDGGDGDMHYYMHADIHATADFGDGVTVFVKIGDWGNFGRHPIYGIGPHGLDAHIMAAYVSAQNLFESPIGFTAGIIPVLYGDIAFDGGENGFAGLKFNVVTDMFALDLFSYRMIEAGGMVYIGGPDPGPDMDLHGAWATIMLPDANIEINGFGFLGKYGEDSPMWVGARSTGKPIEDLYYVADFAMMMGSYGPEGAEVDYGGMYYSARLKYTFVPVTFGGGYYYFSGDDATTADKDEGYYSPTGGPYVNDFYKGWPGFGPAYTLRSPYGFNLVEPDLNVINAFVAYGAEMFNIRGDWFMYSKVEGDPTDMGMEIAVHAWINLSEQFGFGATGGYWMPGDYFAPDEDAMLAGYFYIYKPF